MKTVRILFLLFIMVISLYAEGKLEKLETIEGKGIRTVYQSGMADQEDMVELNRPEDIWQVSDAAAICGEVEISSTGGSSFARWQTNSERVSLYDGEGDIVWEHGMGNLDFDYPGEMKEDGSVIAVGDGDTLKVFTDESAVPYWTRQFDYSLVNIQLSEIDMGIYLNYYSEIDNTTHIRKYMIEEDIPVWERVYPGVSGNLVLNRDDTVLLFTQYGGGHDNLYVLDSATGEQIFRADEYNQNPPSVSSDGRLILNGDYSGYVWVYEYKEEEGTYEELWHYHVNGGGTSDWIGGMSISGDGSTIAVGTLTFMSESYNGQVYLFNWNSPTPLWIYDNAGDYVIDVDLSYDGSLLAVAGYGPYGGEGAEFMLFRRQSNDPVYEIDSPGSLFSVDIAEDGSFCTTGGKGVHAREMGSGGYIYSINCDLGGGALRGTVELEDNENNSGVLIEAMELENYYAVSDSSGNFCLDHLPGGLYTLKYSKLGYEEHYYYDGVVIEGEEMEVPAVTLASLGNPPLNLWASEASGPAIELNWDEPEGAEPAGYFVYRKRYAPDAYPSEPYAIVFSETEYLDENALPQLDYYYIVTAMTDGGGQSQVSNEAQGWSSSGFIVDELSVYTGTEPIIDGQIEEEEWTDAYYFDATDFWGVYDNTTQAVGSVSGYLKMDIEQSFLYCAFINYNDPILEDHDEVAFYIDDNGDGIYPAEDDNSEGNYWAVHYQTGNELRYRPIYETGTVGTVIYLENPQVAASDSEGYVCFEFAIPFGEEDWQINPEESGNYSKIGIFMLDDNDPDPHGFDSWWPHDNLNIFYPGGYGLINYGVEIETPEPPEELGLSEISGNTIQLNWTLPEMNDFDHFNIYFATNDEQFEIIDISLGSSWRHEYEFYPQTSYSYYLTTVNHSGDESIASNMVEYFSTDENPDQVQFVNHLAGNYPNPFNPETTIRFSLATSENTSLCIYNIKGQKVRTLINEKLDGGWHEIVWNGRSEGGKAASGLYFYELKTKGYSSVKKLLLLK